MTMHISSGVTRPLLAGAAILMLLSLAHAHGPAEWIQRGGYKNAAGELCCGERDCFELTDADVKITSAGYFVVSTRETIPFHEATPSPTGTYWRCQWGGARKCFFAPPGST
jgi:hypothetical protein